MTEPTTTTTTTPTTKDPNVVATRPILTNVVKSLDALIDVGQIGFLKESGEAGAKTGIKLRAGQVTTQIRGFASNAGSLKDILATATTVRITRKTGGDDLVATTSADFSDPVARKNLTDLLDSVGL